MRLGILYSWFERSMFVLSTDITTATHVCNCEPAWGFLRTSQCLFPHLDVLIQLPHC